MKIELLEIKKKTTRGIDVVDITDDVKAFLKKSEIKNGLITIFTPGSTAGVTTIEYETGVIEDLKHAISKLAPENIKYLHDQRWEDGNGFSHIRSALIGPSVSIPIKEDAMILGTWQQIVLLEFDVRPRNRRIVMQVIGE